MEDLKMTAKVPKNDRALYNLASIVAKNCSGRKIVTWIKSARFERILKDFFGLSVSFGVSKRQEACNGITVRSFDILSVKEHYLVALDSEFDSNIKQQLFNKGFSDIKDYVFLRHQPIVYDNFILQGNKFTDDFGNTIIGENGTKIKKIVFRGCGSCIKLGKGIINANNLSFDLSSNVLIQLGDACRFNSSVKFEVFGHNGCASVSIGDRCRFTDALFRLYVNPYESAVIINTDCTFETHFEAHANCGKRVILGRDCMVSHNVYLLSGDGHAIFDVNTGKNLNSDYNTLSARKNNIVLGNHVWVGYGAFLMHGTNVGSGSIIGAQSVVKGVYPNNCAIGGNPAKQLRSDCAWARDMGANSIDSINKEYVAKTKISSSPISGKNVLVIGGTRFMGIQLVNELIGLGNKVTIATRGLTHDTFGDKVERILFDISDSKSAKRALKGKKFDIVFDNLAYCSNYVRNVLDNVKCDKYIQLSSIAVYPRKENLLENDFIADEITHQWMDAKGWDNYSLGKKQAEATIVQKYTNVNSVIVRIPYVTKTERLYYYCSHIVEQKPMIIKDVNIKMSFVQDGEVGKFLPWIAGQNYTGCINFSSEGCVSLLNIINYIEQKTGKKAIINSMGDESPFNEQSFSLNIDKVKMLGYNTSKIDEWFWNLLDDYIARAMNNMLNLKDAKESDTVSFIRKNDWEYSDNTILALDYTDCTGCSACYNSCPKDAIEMQTSEKGFIIPTIVTSKCIHCGICKQICPKLNLKFNNKEPHNTYAFMADDATRIESASGGAFSACAEYVLSHNGVVCGAAWTDNHSLEHIIIEKEHDLARIRGSKYLQSAIGLVFRKIKQFLDKQQLVLFVGTPCQVDGLLHYLKKDYSNLITIDLLCRGVPSSMMFNKHLEDKYGTEKLKQIEHKSKKCAGWGAYTRVEHQSGNVEFLNMETDIWMKAYLSDLMFRESCYRCPYPQTKRIGDLSIGDFWQVAKLDKTYDDKKGTSIVMTNTTKGENLINSVNNKLLKAVPLEFEKPFNSAITCARKEPKNRSLFFEMLKKMPFGAALDRALFGRKYDIGIIGWWSNLNYGGTLTYYALHEAVKSLGYSVMMIQQPHSKAVLPNTNTVPMRFARKHYIISRLYTHNDMHLLNYACKGFISGSDQLWNPWLEQYAGKEYFLSFANKNSLRVSYASSFGNVSSFPSEFIAKYKPELKKFDAVSVREDYAVDLSKKYFDTDATFVCDPVFLCDKQKYESMAEESKCIFPSKFTLNFMLDPNEKKSEAIKFVAKKYKSDYVCFTDLQNVEQKKSEFNLANVFANHEIEDLVKAYTLCDFVITDSFHGTCFAIIFNKPFISIANKERGARRFESLLRWTGLTDRLVYSIEEIFEKPDLFKPINYEKVNNRVDEFRQKSISWLKDALAKMKY